ncbi:serine-rich adhesin for platelets [Eurosta solidaginis]|uniref:serine-rich adhesin for platelets n=1 Tax=Eurosta solidaginis TaxID=178769 RepID=UPI003530F433
MESNNTTDPLEKYMQELEAANAASNNVSAPPQSMELPHRPIMLPPEVKEEPLETGSTQMAEAIDNQLDATQIAPLHINEVATVNVTESSAVAANDTESATNSALGTIDPVTTDNIESSADDLTISSSENALETSATTSARNTTAESVSVNKITVKPAATLMLDSVIKVKKEALEDGELTDECSNESAKAKEAQAPAAESQQENVLGIHIKSEQIDKNVAAADQSTTAITPTSATFGEGATIAPVVPLIPTTSAANKNTETAEPDETLPESFFDDLLQNADDITAAALQAPVPAATTTPVIKAIPINELKVKSEPTLNDVSPEPTQSANIPDNFFDDLLVDHAAERLEDVVNNDLERKFSERLKELEQLESITSKAHKKHKKKKKKSHKRSHSEAMDTEESPDGKQKRNKRREIENAQPLSLQPPMRIRVKSEFSNVPLETINLVEDDEPTTSSAAASASAKAKQNTNWASTGRLRIKSEFSTFAIETPTIEEVTPDISLPVRESELFQRRTNVNRNGLIIDMTAPLGFKRIKLEKDVDKSRQQPPKNLLPADKIQRAKQRALDAIEAFKNFSKEEKEPMSAFIYTTTLRKLPGSYSYLKQQIYENRSPLNNVNNVSYKFNSHAFRFNLYEWGIEEMPRAAAKVGKVLGFDYYALLKKMETFKIPLKLQKIKKERMEQESEEQKRYQPQSSFLITVATQTNEVTVYDPASSRRNNGSDIGVQVMPTCETFGTQTLCLANSGLDELPLMRQISTLNENQLIALSDFVDLISEPGKPEASAFSLYHLRQRLLDIYNCSQEPSVLEQPAQRPHPRQVEEQPVVTNNNHIKNMRDPRNRAHAAVAAAMAAAVTAGADDEPPPPPPSVSSARRGHQRPMTQQHAAVPQKIPVIANVQSYHPSAGLLPPASTLEASTSRYYGRGGMRR